MSAFAQGFIHQQSGAGPILEASQSIKTKEGIDLKKEFGMV
ncbi:MAG: hypothetical protein AB1585_18475 [Thermodesulfobacteriota bacterium]